MSKHQKKKQKPTKKTILIIVAVVVVAAVLAGFGIHAIVSRNQESAEWRDANGETNSRIDGAADMLVGGNADSEAAEAVADTEEDASAADAEDASGEMSESEGVDSSQLVGFLPDFGNQGNNGRSAAQGGELVEVEIPTISFPYTIPGTDLVVEQVSPYSGYFLEDGSDQNVSNIAAIVLTNNGGDLDFAGIGIAQGDRSLGFSASQIPAGATVIIQEQNRASYASGSYYSCTATVTESDSFSLSNDQISVEDNGDNSFRVANISDETIPEVKVYFKNFLPGEDVYVGGITYSVTLTDLEPEMGTDVTPSHYDSNYSTIIEVVTDE